MPGGGWESVEAGRVVIPVTGVPGLLIEVNRCLIQKGHSQQLVVYGYQAQGQPVSGEVGAKLQLVKNAIFHNRTDGALIRLSSPIYNKAFWRFSTRTSLRQIAISQVSMPPSTSTRVPRRIWSRVMMSSKRLFMSCRRSPICCWVDSRRSVICRWVDSRRSVICRWVDSRRSVICCLRSPICC
ncbi:MAG: EpsI family protein [Deltaproteobacteria bacterium]|nr:EpsI family protein [Deltaproteobacteria bacterium]